LKQIININNAYDSVINMIIEEHERLKKLDLFVDTQHEVAKKGSFVELKLNQNRLHA